MTIPCYPCRDPRKNNNKNKPKMHTGCCIFAPFQHQTSPGSGSSFTTNPAAQCWCQEHAKPRSFPTTRSSFKGGGGEEIPAAAVIPSNINASFPKGSRGAHALQAATDTDSQMCCLCCSSCASRICCFVGSGLPGYFFGR